MTTSRVNADELKMLLPLYLECIGHLPILTTNGTKLSALCPLHEDRKPSFAAVLRGNAWLWKCYPCAIGGTVLDLHAARSGHSIKSAFGTICREVAEIVGVDATADYSPPIRKAFTPPVKLSKALDADEIEALTTPWRTRLCEDSALREAFARELKLSPDTLRRLTTPSLDSMGIAPAGLTLTTKDGSTCTLRRPRLAYVGDGGFKIRDPFGTGEPRFWRVGELRRPWRSHWLLRTEPTITAVHFVESESTAAALMEAGFQDPFGQGSCVVASSGANGFDVAWKPLFAGRTVHFWPDNDPAGKRFFEDTAAILHGTAKRICRHKISYPDA